MSSPSDGVGSFGADIAIGNLANGSSSAWTSVAEVVSFTNPEESVTRIDLSNLNSPGAVKESTPGMIDPGTIDLGLTWTKATETQLNSLLRVRRDVRITFPDASGITTTTVGSTLVVPAFITKKGADAPLDGKISAKCTFTCAGLPVFTAGS